MSNITLIDYQNKRALIELERKRLKLELMALDEEQNFRGIGVIGVIDPVLKWIEYTVGQRTTQIPILLVSEMEMNRVNPDNIRVIVDETYGYVSLPLYIKSILHDNLCSSIISFKFIDTPKHVIEHIERAKFSSK